MGQPRGRRVATTDRVAIVTATDSAQDDGCRLAHASLALGVSVRTVERWRKSPEGDQRRGPLTVPANKLSAAERADVLATVNSAEYCDKSAAQIVPLLADKGVYMASESTIVRILKEEGLNAHRSRAKPAERVKPAALIAVAPNQVWSWDITFLKSDVAGIFFYLYLVMDIYSRKIVGYEVHEQQTSELASSMIEKICKVEQVSRQQITLHSDNGKPMKGATMLATLQRLGVVPSFSRPSVSDDNPFSESLFRTLKYRPSFPSQPFSSALEASKWVAEFIEWYNNEHLHSSIRFITPTARHNGEDIKQLEQRKIVYENAKANHPERWNGSTRNWEYIDNVCLNDLQRRRGESSTIAA